MNSDVTIETEPTQTAAPAVGFTVLGSTAPTQGEIYVMSGPTAREWSGCRPLGPFATEHQARAAIRREIEELLEVAETLSVGRDKTWCDQYTLVRVENTVQPVVKVTASVSLQKSATDQVSHRADKKGI